MKTTYWMATAGLALAGALSGQTILDEVQQLRQIQIIPFGGASALPVPGEVTPISGKPYSAIARTVEYSPDGVHVDQSQSDRVYRDDMGRTRREVNGGKMVIITDPVAGLGYNLQTETKTAIKRTIAMRSEANAALEMSIVEEVKAQASRLQNGGRGGNGAAKVTVDDLGVQVVNGVTAQGVRTTSIIPTGTFGNDHDLKSVTERWVSEDLHVLVKSVYTDSRTGQTVYDLINISQAAPDPGLFQVPAGYTVQEGGGRGGRGRVPAATVQPGRGGR